VLRKEKSCALLCHCRHHLEAEDDEALFAFVRDHLVKDHPSVPLGDEQASEMVATRSYHLEYLLVDVDGAGFEEEQFGPEPY
jgi:hypothetical protein